MCHYAETNKLLPYFLKHWSQYRNTQLLFELKYYVRYLVLGFKTTYYITNFCLSTFDSPLPLPSSKQRQPASSNEQWELHNTYTLSDSSREAYST